MIRNSRIFAFNNLLVKSLHIICTKRWVQCAHFVKNASQRPNITLRIIRHVTPYFRTSIIRSTSLSVTEPFLHYFRYVEITKFGLHISIQEYVGTFHISVQNLPIVKSFKSTYNLDKYVPYLLFFDVGFTFLIATYFLEHITVVGVLHYQTIY